MTQRELKQNLYELVCTYFGGAKVVWGRGKKVRGGEPMVVLYMGSVERPYQPITKNNCGVPVNCYPSKTTLQIDLYTKGDSLSNDDTVTAPHENTAVDDLTDFVNFINSAYVDNWSGIHDISILGNQIHDLTELINDTSWDYRAMVELEIGFTQNAVGYTGTMYENGKAYCEDGSPVLKQPTFKQTPSGGRTRELAGQYAGWFEQVENPKYEKEEELF